MLKKPFIPGLLRIIESTFSSNILVRVLSELRKQNGAQFHYSTRITKLISKVVTEWLKTVTASVVHQDQTCVFPGHTIFLCNIPFSSASKTPPSF